jgi:hypothetical protein
VFTHSVVGKPGTPDAERKKINAGVWRYHPTRHVFEVFAEGTSNPWGLDYDAHGEFFNTACVIPHLYHILPGARYQRQAGQHFNPYTYDDIKTIADHAHYAGAKIHRPDALKVPETTDAVGGGTRIRVSPSTTATTSRGLPRPADLRQPARRPSRLRSGRAGGQRFRRPSRQRFPPQQRRHVHSRLATRGARRAPSTSATGPTSRSATATPRRSGIARSGRLYRVSFGNPVSRGGRHDPLDLP